MNDAAYLSKYREAFNKKRRIEEMVHDLRGICKSLDNWQDTAEGLATLGGAGTNDEWAPARLAGLGTLRAAMVEYKDLTRELGNMWGTLAVDARVGLSAPETLRK